MKIEIDIPIEELDYESDYDYSDKGNHIDVLIENDNRQSSISFSSTD